MVSDPLFERRRAVRYRLGAPALFSWNGPQPERFRGEGRSRDISREGAFICSPTCPPAGAIIRLEILLPRMHGSTVTTCIQAQGRVVRIEHANAGGQSDGFAVTSKGFTLCPAEKNGEETPIVDATFEELESHNDDE